MNKKYTQNRYVSFEEIFADSVRDLFYYKSKSSLINYKELNLIDFESLKLINFKQLNLIKWSDLKLIDMNLLSNGFQYIGAVSFLILFVSSLVLSVLIDEYSYKSKLMVSRTERKLAFQKVMFEKEINNLANGNGLAYGYVLGDSDAFQDESLSTTTDEIVESQKQNYTITSTEKIENIEAQVLDYLKMLNGNIEQRNDNPKTEEVVLYREGLCSFSIDDVVYSSGSVMNQYQNEGYICVKGFENGENIRATYSDSFSERDLNLTENCFSVSKVSGANTVSISLYDEFDYAIGGCNLLLSSL